MSIRVLHSPAHVGEGGDLANWNYYLALAMFRLASINQGVFMRSLKGNISSDREIANQTEELAA